MAYSTQQLQEEARRIAAEEGVDPALFMGLIQQESGWNPTARSPVGAFGLTQIMPATAANPGFGLRGLSGEQLNDPIAQLRFGARYLKTMLNRYDGNVDKALASYNWGAGNVDKYGVDPDRMPAETRGYLHKVKGFADDFGTSGSPYAIKPSVGDDYGTSALGAYGFDGYDDYGIYAEPAGGDGPASSEYGSTVGADRSGLGSILGGAAKGFMGGGLPGAVGGALMGAVANMSQNRAAAQAGLTGRDVMGAAINAVATGNVPGALGGLVSGKATQAAGRAVGSAVGATPDDKNFGFGDAISAGLKGFMSGGPAGLLGAVAGGYIADKARPTVDNVKAAVGKAVGAGLGFTGANAVSSGIPNDALTRELAAIGLYGAPPTTSSSITAGDVRNAPGLSVDPLADAMRDAIRGGGSSQGSSFGGGGGGYSHGSDANRGGARGW